MTMKMNELVAHFEDLNEQVKQLRDEVRALQRDASMKSSGEITDRKRKTKADDVEFGKALQALIVKAHDHPYIKDRDVFTTWHMHIVITSLMSDADSGLTTNVERMLSKSSRFGTKTELRMMCNRLVNSGLFITRKAQRYIPAMPEYNQKPSRRRSTAIIIRNFDKYKDMTESKMQAEMEKQEALARQRNQQMLKSEQSKAKTTELDSDVSFL